MPFQRRGDSGGEDSQSRRRRRRKQRPVRFSAGAATPSPPREEEEEEHAAQNQLPHEIEENLRLDAESDESGTDPEEFDEVVAVSLSELRVNVRCPICLGIIKKTRTVMGCLHRFCRECIDKSMRLGNNECPTCRMHCASRRSLRDDLDFDNFISSIYPDLEKYEQEESVLHEEERTRNEQIQESISQISQRQSEALVKVCKLGRDADSPSTSRTPRNCRNSYSRRRNFQKNGVDDSTKNHSDKDRYALNDDYQPETSQRRRGRRKGVPTVRSPHIVIDVEEVDGLQSGAETPSEDKRSYSGPLNSDLLTWGRGGIRSNNRHGGVKTNNRHGGVKTNEVDRSKRIQRLTEHLSNMEHEHEHAPVITTYPHEGEMLWLKNHIPSISNPSNPVEVLQPPPETVKKLSEQSKSITIPPWMRPAFEKTGS